VIPGKPPTQFNGSRQFALLVGSGANRSGICVIDEEHSWQDGGSRRRRARGKAGPIPGDAVSVLGFRLRSASPSVEPRYAGNQISTTSGNPSRLGLPTAWDGCYPIRFAFLSRRTRESRGMRQDALLPRFGVYQNF
jgi:hypothetical protein